MRPKEVTVLTDPVPHASYPPVVSDPRAGRILLLGDPATRPAGLERALARAGYRLIDNLGEQDGTAAAPPDVILISLATVDWALSQLLEELAARPGWRHLPRIVLVADAAPVAVAAALRAGADDAAGPAAPLEEIVARIGGALRRQQAAPVEVPPPASQEPFPGGLTPAQFRVRLNEEVARATRYSLSFAVVQAELAGLEPRAGQPGEARVERLVADTAEVLRSVLRVPDFAARSDRASFMIALPETDQEGAAAWVERWRRALDLRLGVQGQPVVLRAGQSTLPQPLAPDATELLAAAATDLERARRVGD
jgi:PleD family two-component response regulator